MRFSLAIAALAFAFLVAGCGGEEFMTTNMTAVENADGFSLMVSAAPDNIDIQTGGALTIMVSALDPAGEGVDSAAIILTATMGTLTDIELTTDTEGFAVTTLTAPEQQGYGVVVGTYKGIQAMVQVDFWSSSAESDTGG